MQGRRRAPGAEHCPSQAAGDGGNRVGAAAEVDQGRAQVPAVLRSWDERYGPVVAWLGFDILTLVLPQSLTGPQAE